MLGTDAAVNYLQVTPRARLQAHDKWNVEQVLYRWMRLLRLFLQYMYKTRARAILRLQSAVARNTLKGRGGRGQVVGSVGNFPSGANYIYNISAAAVACDMESAVRQLRISRSGRPWAAPLRRPMPTGLQGATDAPRDWAEGRARLRGSKLRSAPCARRPVSGRLPWLAPRPATTASAGWPPAFRPRVPPRSDACNNPIGGSGGAVEQQTSDAASRQSIDRQKHTLRKNPLASKFREEIPLAREENISHVEIHVARRFLLIVKNREFIRQKYKKNVFYLKV